MLERDDADAHQQAGRRLLEGRDPEVASPPPVEAQHNQILGKVWLPFYMRRSTALLFLVWFVLMAGVLEVLSAVSKRNSGLSQGVSSMRYFWSYGTTGVLTVTAAFWHRLDYDTKVSAPWLRAYPTTTSNAALLVDYIDAWSLAIPLRAFRNQDYQVVYSSTISLLLQTLIVLSTALFTLKSTHLVNNAEPVFLTSRFVDDPGRLKNSDSLLPYYITMGTERPLTSTSNLSEMMGAHPTHPEGCTNQFAYETFSPNSPHLEQVEATVRGLALRISCETATVGEKVQTPQLISQIHGLSYTLAGDDAYFEIYYQGCQTNITWYLFKTEGYNSDVDVWVENNKTFRERGMMLRGVPGFTGGQCNSTDQAAHRVVFLSAEVELRSSNRSIIYDGYEAVEVDFNVTVLQSVALVCIPSLEQPLLNVSKSSGGVQRVSRHNGVSADLLDAVHPWDFIDFVFDENIISQSTVGVDTVEVEVGNTTAWADVYSQLVLGLCGQSCMGAPGPLNDPAFLENILATFLADYAATTAHAMLTERVNITSTGTSSSIVVRLWVQPVICQTMVALLAILILIMVGFQFGHQKKLPRSVNPGSIAATAILAGQAVFSTFPKGMGPTCAEELHKVLRSGIANQSLSHSESFDSLEQVDSRPSRRDVCPVSSHTLAFKHPLPLRPASQTALILIIAACGTTLMVLLRKSGIEKGLGDAADSKYLLFAWTTAPAAILTVISWWVSSIDTQVRLLAPYNSLRTSCSHSILRMDLLRGLAPVVLYQELKTSNFAAASTTFASLLAATLTTVSAAMFHVLTFPVSRPVELSPHTAFLYPTPKPDLIVNDSNALTIISPSYTETSRLSSLILETNLSYPQGSFEDLVFPGFSMTSHELENVSHAINASSAIIKVTTPAMRPRISCRIYSPSEISAIYVRNQSVAWSPDPWTGIFVNVTMETCEQYSSPTTYFETGNLSHSLFAGVGVNQAGTIEVGGCSPLRYIWGYHDTSPGPVTNISAVSCNNSVELVDATISLVGSDLTLDPSDTPIVNESTVRDIRDHGVMDSFDWYEIYGGGLASLPATNQSLFDPFFQQLVTSRYAVPVSAIGDPTRADIVMDAIRLQHGIIEAQFLSANYRIDMNSSSLVENASAVLIPTLFNHSASDDSARYLAVATYPYGSNRVVQDATATVILETLLLIMLILVMAGWCLGSREPPLPRSPSSVASILALLAGGNVLERVYDGGPEPLCWHDLKRRLGKNSKFYLGWDPSNTGEEFELRRFGIWIIDESE